MAERNAGDGPAPTPPPGADSFSFVVPGSGELRRRVLRVSIVVGVVLLLVAGGIGIGAAITAARTATRGSSAPPAGLAVGSFADDGSRPIAGLPSRGGPATASGRSSVPKGAPPPPSGEGASTPLPPSPPARLWIPAIGVSSELVRLGLQDDGSLQVPSDFSVAGWWVGGASPGEKGPAVIVGHVDSGAGPAVFYRLQQLRPGDVVWVAREDHADVRFVVQRLERVPKARFPTRAVYGPQPEAALRLVTCGGAFDRSTGHYVDNVIVFAAAAR
jgi:hypothetical protein